MASNSKHTLYRLVVLVSRDFQLRYSLHVSPCILSERHATVFHRPQWLAMQPEALEHIQRHQRRLWWLISLSWSWSAVLLPPEAGQRLASMQGIVMCTALYSREL